MLRNESSGILASYTKLLSLNVEAKRTLQSLFFAAVLIRPEALDRYRPVLGFHFLKNTDSFLA